MGARRLGRRTRRGDAPAAHIRRDRPAEDWPQPDALPPHQLHRDAGGERRARAVARGDPPRRRPAARRGPRRARRPGRQRVLRDRGGQQLAGRDGVPRGGGRGRYARGRGVLGSGARLAAGPRRGRRDGDPPPEGTMLVAWGGPAAQREARAQPDALRARGLRGPRRTRWSGWWGWGPRRSRGPGPGRDGGPGRERVLGAG